MQTLPGNVLRLPWREPGYETDLEAGIRAADSRLTGYIRGA